VAELAQGLGLDLADAFAGDREVLADLLQGVLAAAPQPEAHLDHLLLAGSQGLEQGP
jgi:Holliday junction resolvasome RuvABC ATP-dependent DNA helicase subunit